MSKPFGQGLRRSLRAKVNRDVRELLVENETLRRARYGLFRRAIRMCLVDHSVIELIAAYVASLPIILILEWLLVISHPSRRTLVPDASALSLLKDINGIFVTAQVGMLAIVTVAVGVVTLLSQRDDGTSSSADVRLYYFESYSYEVAFSGVALLIVLTAQFFWPLRFFQERIGGVWGDVWCRNFATAEHAAWLIVNLWLFSQFIGTTLRFVEPSSRIDMRERFSANEVIPEDVRRRLQQAYYRSLSVILWPSDGNENRPPILFGSPAISPERSICEVSIANRQPSRLADVWVRPLAWALQNWRHRCEINPEQARFASLAIPINFETVFTGRIDLVMRANGVPLNRLERFAIRNSFRFTRADNRVDNLPDPTVIIAQLVSHLVGQIDMSRPNGFDAALDELVRYHSFALAAQNTRDDSGSVFNLAEVGPHFIWNPVTDWAREYRRAFVAAAQKLSADTWFMKRMAPLAARLWPADPENYSATVLNAILDFGRNEIIALEEWLSERARATTTDNVPVPTLSGADLRAYDHVLSDIVSSWETTASVVLHSYQYGAAITRGNEAFWQQAVASWPALQRHLWITAYFLAAAVWNEDTQGAEQFRDMLLRWLHPFYSELHEEYRVRETTMLTPELFHCDWSEIQAEFTRDPLTSFPPLSSRTAFGAVMRQGYNDIICLTGALLIHWHVTQQQNSPTTARSGLLTLSRERLAGGGVDLSHEQGGNPKSIFRMIFDVMLREALRSPFDKASYSAVLSGAVDFLNEMSSPRMMPGRIYTGFGMEGFDRLVPELLAILAANLPQTGDEGVSAIIAQLIEQHPVFQEDRRLRDLAMTFEGYAQKLQGDPDDRFRATAELYGVADDLPERRNRLAEMFRTLGHSLEASRIQMLRDAALDPKKLGLIVDGVSAALTAGDALPGFFVDVKFIRSDFTDIPNLPHNWRRIDKGALVTPPKSAASFDDTFSAFIEIEKDWFRNLTWGALHDRSHETIKFGRTGEIGDFYRMALARIASGDLGDDAAMIVPYARFGQALHMSVMDDNVSELTDFSITRDPTVSGGHGNAYCGAIDGVPVFSAPFNDAAVICSRRLLKSVTFGAIAPSGRPYAFEIIDHGDPTESEVNARIAPLFAWGDQPHVVIILD